MAPFYLFLFLLLLFNLHLSSASNSIIPQQTISGTQKLTSDGGSFELGFFRPGNSSFYYLGIFYSLNRVSQLTPVWIANRDTPLADHTKNELKISGDGNLILSNHSNPLIWSTNTTVTTSNSPVVVLLDTGNLVLRDGSYRNITLWQSFDHPTNTWLPGAKVGLNKVTGESQRLISWKNQEDPSPGIFSLEADPNETRQYFLLWNNSYMYWASGIWNGQFFSAVPEMTGDSGFSFQYVSDATASYFSYSIKGEYGIISRLVLDVSGKVEQLLWVEKIQQWVMFWSQPRAQCQVHALCGPFGNCNGNVVPFCSCIKGFSEKSPSDWGLSDPTGGCARNTPLQCSQNRSGLAVAGKDKFYTMLNVRLPDNAQTSHVASASDCELSCLNSCSCVAYSYSSRGCSVWDGVMLNLREQSDGGTIFIRLAASELLDSKHNKNHVIVAVAGGFSGSLALLFSVWLLIYRRGILMSRSEVLEGGLTAFRYSNLQHMTKNFSQKLGGGGYGSVFKGVLSDSTEIAVKKLEGLQQGEKQFRTEVSTIGTIHHVNLVRLHGFCSEGVHRLLVYEYMPNGSLDTQLFRNEPGQALDWKTRYEIATGIARGLTYLHEQCRDCIVHCDIKPENILLDASFVPKVADFGLAKIFGRDCSRVLTTMRGTIGYLAPEWISGEAITAKADVYSYGMMLFEIISGKRNLDQGEGSNAGFFPCLAVSKLLEWDAIGYSDNRIDSDANFEEVVRACKVACWCIQDDENSRPTMGEVVQILEKTLEINMPPIPRILYVLAGQYENSLPTYSPALTSASAESKS